MDNRILLGGAAVLVVGAAFGGGYYVNHAAAPQPAVTAPQPLPQTAEQPTQTVAPAAEPVAETAAAPVAAYTQPIKKKRRIPDYASGENAYDAPPPPPPPPPPDFRNRPNPFEGRFSTFPMHHSGAGTLNSPLTWTAQTEFGNGHEADLRISVVVPMPAPNDNGTFWSRWGSRGGDDVMPDITRGTPVVVAASASIIVAIDPEFLDLDAPAILAVNGPDGQRIYRSRDVAPARGESWDSQGARWIFQPDADFFRMMRDGANVSVSLRSRMSGNPITVPFSTDDFPPSLNGFERDLYGRMPGIAAAWDRARPGAPPPPPPQAGYGPPPSSGPQPGYPPRPYPGFGGPGYPQGGSTPQQYGPQPHGYAPPNTTPPAAPYPQPAQQAGSGYGHGQNDHTHDHGGANQAPPAPQAANPSPPPPVAKPPAASPPPAKPPAAAPPTATPAAPKQPGPAHGGMTPPAKPAAPPAAPPQQAIIANPGATMIAAEVAAYRQPTDDCGPQPALPQSQGPSPERKQSNIWLKCRAHWMDMYKKSITMLGRDANHAGTTLQAVNGGSAVINAFETAQGQFNAQKAAIKS